MASSNEGSNIGSTVHSTLLTSVGYDMGAKPPPALARTVLEQLCEMKHMFPNSRHVFICPSLMTGCWRKTLQKLADVTHSLSDCGKSNQIKSNQIWGHAQFEPLTIAFVCPLLDSTVHLGKLAVQITQKNGKRKCMG